MPNLRVIHHGDPLHVQIIIIIIILRMRSACAEALQTYIYIYIYTHRESLVRNHEPCAKALGNYVQMSCTCCTVLYKNGKCQVSIGYITLKIYSGAHVLHMIRAVIHYVHIIFSSHILYLPRFGAKATSCTGSYTIPTMLWIFCHFLL